MNPKQLDYSIFEAVSNAIQRVWTTEEKELIANDSKLQNHLKESLNNSLSDTCWHQVNYKIVRDLSSSPNFSLPMDIFEDEEIHIPF
ncbi:hypothetical protein [Nostoc sp.]